MSEADKCGKTVGMRECGERVKGMLTLRFRSTPFGYN